MPLQADLESVRAWLQATTGLTTRISAKPAAITHTGLDLWPWRIEEDAALRNRLPPRPDSPGRQAPPAALKLYFLVLSAHGLDDLDRTHQVLHDHPVLAAAERPLPLKPHALDATQANALFVAAQCPLRPFLSYELRSVAD